MHLKRYRKGFPLGLTRVTDLNEGEDDTGIRFSILKLKQGDSYAFEPEMELALLHLGGEALFECERRQWSNRRDSLFDESPFALHLCRGTKVAVSALSDAEVAVFETENKKRFPGKAYLPAQTGAEQHGKGLVDNASLRLVRTIFDNANSHSNAELVLGEVVNFPGRWSSYPPHHHPQPEIYHYRFTDARGYGHAELGDDVLKVRPYDTVKILHELDHAQCAAPGYGMYYLWVIRHLPDNRYTVPEFSEAHRWTLDREAQFWMPRQEALR